MFFFFFYRFILVAVIFGIHLSSSHSSGVTCNNRYIHLYFYVYLAVLFTSFVNDAIITFISSRGTIFEKEKRSHIAKLLYLRLALLLFEAGWVIYGCYQIFGPNISCSNNYDRWLLKAVVIFNFIWVVGCIVVLALSFDSAGKIWYRLDKKVSTGKKYGSMDTLDFDKRIREKNESSWVKSCRLLFCCTTAETSKDNVLLFAAKLFSDYFHCYNDLVPSDILAGLILLRQKQKFDESQRVKKELKDTDASYQQVSYEFFFVVMAMVAFH